MYAVDDLSDAIDVTRRLFTPIRAWMWAKLAIVVFFVGSGGLSVQFFDPTFTTTTTPEETEPAPGEPTPGELSELVGPEFLLVAGIIAVIVIGIWFVFAAIGALMEFVLVGSLGEGDVQVRKHAKEHLGRAARLLGFRIGLTILGVLAIGIPILVGYLGGLDGTVLLVAIAAFVFYTLALVFAFWLIDKFTTELVVPVMLLEERGVISGWKRLWPTLTAEWKEYGVYAILSWLVGVIISIGVGVLTLILTFIIGIPLLIVFVLLLFIPVVGWLIAAVLAVVAVIFFLLVFAAIEAPIVSYLRYYALLVLGDTNDELDLIPEQRAAVRADGGEPVDSGGPDDGARGSGPDGADSEGGRNDDDAGWGLEDDDERNVLDEDERDDLDDVDDEDDEPGGWEFEDRDDDR